MFALVVLSWACWLLVFFNAVSKDTGGYAVPYPLLLVWFIVNLALAGAS